MNNYTIIINFINTLEKKTYSGEITWVKNGECYQTDYGGEIYFVLSRERTEMMVITTDLPDLQMKAEKMLFNQTHIVFWKDIYHLYCIIESKAKKVEI